MILLLAAMLFLLRVFYLVAECCYERDWPRKTWRGLAVALGLLIMCGSAFAQISRVDIPLQTSGPNVPVVNGPLPQTLWTANAIVVLCAHVQPYTAQTYANCVATSLTTYIDGAASATCPTAKPLVQLPGNTCTAATGTTANIGFWYSGGLFDYYVTTAYGTFGPFSGPTGGSSGTTGSLANPTSIGKTVLLGDGTIEANLMAFGATHSQQTATCTASGGPTLTGCSGGDFKVGNYVYIQAAGVAPTISAPAAPMLACNTDNGGSCTGSVVYHYKIAAIQGWPNGPVSAASTAASITQAAQSPQYRTGTTVPDVYTTVSWSAVANATHYIVYKAINSGPYQYLATVLETSINDYGHVAQSIFTCVDDAVPCSPPASAVPNDVYAQITGITGSSMTLSAFTNGYQPVYGSTTLSSSTYPSAPSISGTVTVQHDDTPAIYAAYRYFLALNNPGYSALYMPAGNYNLHNEDPTYSRMAVRLDGLSNFTLYGDGDATQLYQSNDRAGILGDFVLSVCGGTNSPVTCTGTYYFAYGSPSSPTYTLADPVNAGATTVTLATPSQASNFPAGTWLNLFDLVSSYATNYPANTYGELNQVISSNSTTGQLVLAYPANKMYSSSLTGLFNAFCPSCAGPPTISPFPNGIVANHITFKNFLYRGDNLFLDINTMDYFTLESLNITANLLEDAGILRHHFLYNSTVTSDPNYDSNGQLSFLIGAAGAGDYKASNNTFHFIRGRAGAQECSEGSSNFDYSNNTFTLDGIADGSSVQGLAPILGGGGVCYNLSIKNNHIDVNSSSLYAAFSYDAASVETVTGNSVNVDSLGPTGSLVAEVAVPNSAGTTSQVYNNQWNIGAYAGVPGDSQYTQNGGLSTPPLSTFTLPSSSGGISFYGYYGLASANVIPMTGNITSVNLGSARIQGWAFYLIFQQPSSGGPYALPVDCTGSHWGVTVDCPNGPPVANPAASSSTYVYFYDDGTTVHFLGSNYGPSSSISTNNLTDWTNAGVTNGLCPVWNSGTSKWTPGACNGTGSGLTSIALALPVDWSVSGSPLTTNGTITGSYANETAHYVHIGPSSGSASTPTWRLLVPSDVAAAGTLTNNTSGTAANLSGTPAVPNGTSATTQTTGDTSTDLATDGFVANAIGAGVTTVNGTSCALNGSCTPTIPGQKVTTSTYTIPNTYSNGKILIGQTIQPTATVITLPTPAFGKLWCAKNFVNASNVAETAQIELLVANTGTQVIVFNGAVSSSGYVLSAGASGDEGCVFGASSTQWDFTPSSAGWVLH
jgi:hypothetical protein